MVDIQPHIVDGHRTATLCSSHINHSDMSDRNDTLTKSYANSFVRSERILASYPASEPEISWMQGYVLLPHHSTVLTFTIYKYGVSGTQDQYKKISYIEMCFLCFAVNLSGRPMARVTLGVWWRPAMQEWVPQWVWWRKVARDPSPGATGTLEQDVSTSECIQ